MNRLAISLILICITNGTCASANATSDRDTPKHFKITTLSGFEKSHLFDELKLKKIAGNSSNAIYIDPGESLAVALMTKKGKIIRARITDLHYLKTHSDIFPETHHVTMFLFTDLIFGSEKCVSDRNAVNQMLEAKARVNAHPVRLGGAIIRPVAEESFELGFGDPNVPWLCGLTQATAAQYEDIIRHFYSGPSLEEQLKKDVDDLKLQIAGKNSQIRQLQYANTILLSQKESWKQQAETNTDAAAQLARSKALVAQLQGEITELQGRSLPPARRFLPDDGPTERPSPQHLPDTSPTAQYRNQLCKHLGYEATTWGNQGTGTVSFTVNKHGDLLALSTENADENHARRLERFIRHCAPFPVPNVAEQAKVVASFRAEHLMSLQCEPELEGKSDPSLTSSIDPATTLATSPHKRTDASADSSNQSQLSEKQKSAYRSLVSRQIAWDALTWDQDQFGKVRFTLNKTGDITEVTSGSDKLSTRLCKFIRHCAPFPPLSASESLSFIADINGTAVSVDYAE